MLLWAAPSDSGRHVVVYKVDDAELEADSVGFVLEGDKQTPTKFAKEPESSVA